jgi:hypothetical protein
MSALIANRVAAITLPRITVQRAALFSTSTAMRSAEVNAAGNPSYPRFSFKNLTSNPRTRRFLIGGLVVLCGIEGATWYTFGPKILENIKGKKE